MARHILELCMEFLKHAWDSHPVVQAFILNFLAAVLILLVGWTVSGIVGRSIRRLAARSSRIDPTMVPMLHAAAVWSLRIFVIIAVLARFGVQTASLIAALGAAGLAIGLALQGTLQNIAAGIMLLALRPLRAGEYVSIVGKGEGTVQEVGLFLTRLEQYDGVHLTLPNSSVWGSTIINYSRNPTRRLDVEFEISDLAQLDVAVANLEQLARDFDGVLSEPAPTVSVTGFGENTAELTLRVWLDSERYWSQRVELYRQATQRLLDLGVVVPTPFREVRNLGPYLA